LDPFGGHKRWLMPDHGELLPVPEWRKTHEKGVQDDPARPDVHLHPVAVTLIPLHHPGPSEHTGKNEGINLNHYRIFFVYRVLYGTLEETWLFSPRRAVKILAYVLARPYMPLVSCKSQTFLFIFFEGDETPYT